MIEVYGDIWQHKARITCITTNGTIRKDGAAVMGRGVAFQAARKFPSLQKNLGKLLAEYGLGVYPIGGELMSGNPWEIFALPVKYNWWEKADTGLIAISLVQLHYIWQRDLFPDDVVVLPRPGCGNGGLKWEEGPLQLCRSILPEDNFHVITNEENNNG